MQNDLCHLEIYVTIKSMEKMLNHFCKESVGKTESYFLYSLKYSL